MKIILFSRPQSARAAEGLRRLFAAAARLGLDIAVNEEFAPAAAEVLGAPPSRCTPSSSVPSPP